MTSQVADALMEHLAPKGAAVVVEAEHLCMKMRGIQKPNGVMVTSALRGAFKLPRPGEGAGFQANRSLIGLGIATTVSNPFWFLWWVGVGGGYVLATRQDGLIALLAFYLGHITADYTWNTFLASVMGSGRRWFNDRVYRGLLLVCGLFLVYTGLQFVWAGVSNSLV